MSSQSIPRLALVAAVLLFTGCGAEKPQPQQQDPTVDGERAVVVGTNVVAGINWHVPPRWAAHPAGAMRVATYIIPSMEPGTDPGECGVFHFGKDRGGSLDDNISRWIGQFEDPATTRSSREVNKITVNIIQIAGTYLSPGGPMMQSQGKKSDYRLLGAIVDAPGGMVFFKLTGPANTVGTAEKEFNQMVNSITKVSG